MEWSRLETRLETNTSFPNLLSVIRLWLLATWTVHLSISAIIQTASAIGSSNTGCWKKKKRKRNHLKKRKVFKDTVNGMGKEEKLDKNKTKEYETSESYCQRILDGEESSSITNTLRYLIKIIKHSLPEF